MNPSKPGIPGAGPMPGRGRATITPTATGAAAPPFRRPPGQAPGSAPLISSPAVAPRAAPKSPSTTAAAAAASVGSPNYAPSSSPPFAATDEYGDPIGGQVSPPMPKSLPQPMYSPDPSVTDEYGDSHVSEPPVVSASAAVPAVELAAPVFVIPASNFADDDPTADWDPSQLGDIAPTHYDFPGADSADPYAWIGSGTTPDIAPSQGTQAAAAAASDPSATSSAAAAQSQAPTMEEEAAATSGVEEEAVVAMEDAGKDVLAALIAGEGGVDDEMMAPRLRPKLAPDVRRLRVAVCGTQSSNKAAWLVRVLGYGCARKPDGASLTRRFRHDDKAYSVEFAVAEDTFAAAEATYRWADAFVLVWDVENRDSFEEIKQFQQSISREREVSAVPAVLVMNHTTAQAEDTWKVTRAEGATLSDTLNIPLCDVATTATAADSVHTLITQVRKFETGTQEKSQVGERSKQAGNRNMTLHRPQQALTELEFVVLGDAFVGKTTLISKIFDGKFVPHYTATTGKSLRKEVLKLKGENFIIKLVDTPGFFPEQAAVLRDASGGSGGGGGGGGSASSAPPGKLSLESAADMAVRWLQQQSLLQAHGFIICFSVTSRESFLFAQELVGRIQVALVDAPGTRNQVKLLLGTKLDMTHGRVVQDSELMAAATRLGTLHDLASLKTPDSEAVRPIFERLVGELRKQSTPVSRGPIGELDRQGPLLKGKEKKKCKSKRYFVLRDGTLMYGHSEKDTSEGSLSLSESSTVEAIPSDVKAKEYMLHVESDEQSLWMNAASEAERDAWVASIALNIFAAQMAHRVIQEVAKEDLRNRLQATSGVQNMDKMAAFLSEPGAYTTPGKSFMFVPVHIGGTAGVASPSMRGHKKAMGTSIDPNAAKLKKGSTFKSFITGKST